MLLSVHAQAIVPRLRAAGCVFAEDEARLLADAATDATELETLVARRIAGEPLEHLLGWAEFCDLRIAVAPGVFVPRRRTEFLAHQAILLAPADRGSAADSEVADDVAAESGMVAVDMCCGSGALGAALVAALPGLELHAVDVDPAAVACARRNLPGAAVYQGDLYAPLPARLRGRVDLLVANAPYVPTEEIGLMPPEARLHEPRTALDGGADGLDIARRVLAGAREWLSPAGHVLVETSRRQAPSLLAAATAAGLAAQVASSEEHDATVLIASRT